MIASVDGCKGGWLVALSEGWACHASFRFELCSNFAAVRDLTAGCSATVVDVPIGLPEGKEVRAADELAKERLSRAGASTSSVFRTPP
jgi:predicted RNase H-like nuclease